MPEPSVLGEVTWLEPFPDALLAGAGAFPLGPEARYEERESISLAFITALQLLPPRQLAVLMLRDVLGYHAHEVADLLETTLEAVNSALKRARTSLQQRLPSSAERPPPPAAESPAERVLVEKFVRAYGAGDIDALIALFTDDICVSMPPIPNEYRGRTAAARLYTQLIRHGRTYDFVPARANGQAALGTYLRGPDGRWHAAGFAVLTLSGDRICAVTRFENNVLPWFELPATR